MLRFPLKLFIEDMCNRSLQKEHLMRILKISSIQIEYIILILGNMFLLSSCCTLCYPFEMEPPALTITSSVPNADVYLNGKYVGKTPYSHFGDKVDVKEITVKKEGYKTQSRNPRKLKGIAYLNFIPYPLVNWIWGYFYDRKQSKCWEYTDDVFHFYLVKNNDIK